jgi:uncharacterized protein (TIGR02001 family)
MNTKILSAFVGLAVAGILPVHAQTPATETTPASTPAPAPAAATSDTPSSSWVLTGSVASEYMFRGVRLGGLSFQPSIEYDSGNTVLGVWSNFPLADKVDGVSDPEFDFYGSYTLEMTKDLSFQPGFTIYTYPNADKDNGFYKATFEPNVALNYTVGGVKLTGKFYYDFVLKGPTYELSAAYAVPLKNVGTELDFAGTIGTYIWKDAAENTSPDVKTWGNYWLLGVSVPFQVGKNGKLVVGYVYTEGTDTFIKQGTDPKIVNSAAVGRNVVSVSIAITF